MSDSACRPRNADFELNFQVVSFEDDVAEDSTTARVLVLQKTFFKHLSSQMNDVDFNFRTQIREASGMTTRGKYCLLFDHPVFHAGV